MRFLVSASMIALLLGCSGAETGDALPFGEPPSQNSERIHKFVMDNYKAYGSLSEPKVLSGCFTDAPDKSPPVRLRRVFAWHTGRSSDIPIFAGQLRREALKTCLGWAAGENIDCDCKLIDISGKNVLDL